MPLLHDQRGAALLTTLSVTAAALMGIALLMDVFSIYVAKRAGQTAADAAALGAIQVVEQVFNAAAREALQNELDRFARSVSDEVSNRVADWASARRRELREALESIEPPLEPDEINRIISEIIADERPGVRSIARRSVIRSRIGDVAVEQALINGDPVPFVPALREFFSPAELGCLIRGAGALSTGEIRESAAWFAQHNGATQIISVTFPHQEQIKARVVVDYPVPLVMTARFAPTRPLLTVEATSKAVSPGGLTFDLSVSC